jgi:hypothetical protein
MVHQPAVDSLEGAPSARDLEHPPEPPKLVVASHLVNEKEAALAVGGRYEHYGLPAARLPDFDAVHKGEVRGEWVHTEQPCLVLGDDLPTSSHVSRCS